MLARAEMCLREPDKILNFRQEICLEPDKAEYLNKVWNVLDKLEPEKSFEINNLVKSQNLELFIKCVCLYIIDYGNIEFSNDFTRVRRLALESGIKVKIKK